MNMSHRLPRVARKAQRVIPGFVRGLALVVRLGLTKCVYDPRTWRRGR